MMNLNISKILFLNNKIHKYISCNKNNQPNSHINSIKRHVILPQNPTTALNEKNLKYLGIKTITRTTKTDIKKITQKTHSFTETGVYKICCL